MALALKTALRALTIDIPALSLTRVIKDPVHLNIDLTEIEYEILQLPTFNRLHHTKQLSLAYLVYPGAQSSRFLHSIGAMNVASRMAHHVLQSIERTDWDDLFDRKTDSFKLHLFQIVRLAALLHDVGHAPFSLAAEEIMTESVKKKHTNEVENAKALFEKDDIDDVPIHEFFSYKLITRGEICQTIRKHGFDPTDIANVLLKKSDLLVSGCTKNETSIIRRIVSSQLDADRMDYLLRDAYMTGVVYGSTDIDRIISNMLVRRLKRGTDPILVFDERALGALEDLLDARYKMYKWLYGHHMVVACNELLKRALIDVIEDDDTDVSYENFYWGNFSNGRSTEDHMIDSILSKVSKNTESPFRGLIDRRYLPVSVLKRQSEQKQFLAKLSKKLGTRETQESLFARIAKWFREFKKIGSAEIRSRSRERRMLLAINSPRTPYSPLKVNKDGVIDDAEKITIWDARERESSELTALSDYFKKVNEEWRTFPSYYFSYLVPGKKKSEYSPLRDKVEADIIEEMAEIG